jgi:hypothetical protein
VHARSVIDLTDESKKCGRHESPIGTVQAFDAPKKKGSGFDADQNRVNTPEFRRLSL